MLVDSGSARQPGTKKAAATQGGHPRMRMSAGFGYRGMPVAALISDKATEDVMSLTPFVSSQIIINHSLARGRAVCKR
jgi:hypothetical protein